LFAEVFQTPTSCPVVSFTTTSPAVVAPAMQKVAYSTGSSSSSDSDAE
jgi:hypothetical protein